MISREHAWLVAGGDQKLLVVREQGPIPVPTAAPASSHGTSRAATGGGSRSSLGSLGSGQPSDPSEKEPVQEKGEKVEKVVHSRAWEQAHQAEVRDAAMEYADAARLMQEEDDAKFYAQNYGLKLALEQLQSLLDTLAGGSGGGGSSKTPAFSPTFHTEEKERTAVQDLRAEISRLIKRIRQSHYAGLDVKALRRSQKKDLAQRLGERDRLCKEMLHETQNAHWPMGMKAGQYEHQAAEVRGRLKDLRRSVRLWDSRCSIRRHKNLRLSQLITRDGQVARNKAVQEAATAAREAAAAEAAVLAAKQAAELAETHATHVRIQAVLDAAVGAERRYTVANDRVVVFDDMHNIYSTAMQQIRGIDTARPYLREFTAASGAFGPAAMRVQVPVAGEGEKTEEGGEGEAGARGDSAAPKVEAVEVAGVVEGVEEGAKVGEEGGPETLTISIPQQKGQEEDKGEKGETPTHDEDIEAWGKTIMPGYDADGSDADEEASDYD
ncbi:hypothetical protein B484DRAFT_402959 [Ochromonadaceae sp. CCMP2298]|nr:hypothetical protein B484DRAFT_402959 [Ochromonadaceae sp. CCMP2298]